MYFGHRPTGVLKSLTLAELEELRSIGSVRSYRKNELLYELGQPAEEFHLVLRGRIRLRDRGREGQDIVVGFAAEGEAFGHEVLAELSRRVLTASAAEASEVLSVSGESLLSLVGQKPTLHRHLVRHLASELVHQTEEIKMLAFLDVPSRLAGTILWLADRYGASKNGELEVPYWFTHQEMADLIGSTRETVTTVLAEFKRHRLIINRNHHFVVLDREAVTRRIGLPGFARGE